MLKSLHLRLFSVITLMLCGLGVSWAESYTMTPDATTTGSSSTSYVTSETEFTYNGISWKFHYLNPSSLQVKTNQSSSTSEFYIYNTTAFSNNITEVVLTFSALTLSNTSNTGWYLSGNLDKKVGTSSLSTGNAVQGVWDDKAKTLTFTVTNDIKYFTIWQNGKVSTGLNYLAKSDAIIVKTVATQPHTVIFNAGSGTCATDYLEESSIGAGITLPTAYATGWTFEGWSESMTSTETMVSPTIVDVVEGKYYPTNDITLYAVYSKSENLFGVTTYCKITSLSEITTTDEYLLVLEDHNKATNSTISSNAWQTSSITRGENIVTEWAGACPIKLLLSGDKYSIELQADVTDKYISYSGSSTNLSLSNSTVYEWEPIELAASGIYLRQSSSLRHLGSNSGGTIKAYDASNISSTYPPALLYKKVEGNAIITKYSLYPPVPVTITDASYATIYYGTCNLVVPAGVEAYTVFSDGVDLIFNTTYSEGEVIPAGEGVVLKGAAGNYSFAVSPTAGDPDGDNMLRGSDVAAETTGGAKYYKLSLNAENAAGSVGFYWGAEDGAAFTSAAHKAYLAIPAGGGASSAPSFFLFEDNATAINGVENAQNGQSGKCYNLAGQKVSSDFRGIVIVNGKKVVK